MPRVACWRRCNPGSDGYSCDSIGSQPSAHAAARCQALASGSRSQARGAFEGDRREPPQLSGTHDVAGTPDRRIEAELMTDAQDHAGVAIAHRGVVGRQPGKRPVDREQNNGRVR